MATTEDDVVVRLRLKDVAQFIAEVRAGTMSIDGLEKKISSAGRVAARESSESAGGGFGMLSSLIKHLAFAVPMAMGAAGGAVAAFAIKSATDLEMVHVGFTTMLHSAAAANQLIGQLQHFAAVTPFRLSDVESASQKLLAFGWTAKNIIPTLTSVGDAVAGLNLGPGGVEGVITALGQMQMKGRVQGDEILQLNERGINAQKYLMAGLHMNPQQLRKAQETNKIGSDKAIPIILKGMEKDFKGLMDKQSKTLGGIWSNFQDNAQQGLVRIVNPYLPAMKQWLNQLIANMPAYEALLSRVVGQLVTAVRAGAVFAKSLFDWGSDMYDRAKTAVTGYINVVAQALRDGDWTPVGGATGTGLRGALMTGLVAGGGGKGGGTNWLELGKSAVPHILEFILGFVSALLDPIMWLHFIKDNWRPLTTVLVFALITIFTGGLGGAVGKLGEVLLKFPLLRWAGRILVWLQSGINWIRPYFVRFAGRIWDWMWSGFERVFPKVAFQIHYFVLRIGEFFTSTLPGMAKSAGGWASGWIGRIAEVIAEAPWRLLKVIGRFAKWLAKTLVDIVNSAAGVVGSAIVGAVASVFYWLKDKWDTVKGWLGFGGDSGNTTPTPPPTAPSPTGPASRFMFGKPGAASGGTVASAGLSWVGENGPELRFMPRGASIIPLPRAGDFAGAFGGRDIHTHVSVDGREIMHAVHRVQDDKVARR